MLRKTLIVLSVLALFAAVPAVALAAGGGGRAADADWTGPARNQAQQQLEDCQGEPAGNGYGVADPDGDHIPYQPEDGTGYGAAEGPHGAGNAYGARAGAPYGGEGPGDGTGYGPGSGDCDGTGDCDGSGGGGGLRHGQNR